MNTHAHVQERQRFGDSDARQGDIIKLDVGGRNFHVTRSDVTKQLDCLLESMFSGCFRIEAQANGSIFLDRLECVAESACVVNAMPAWTFCLP